MNQLREQIAVRGWLPMFMMFFTFVFGGLSFFFSFSNAFGGEMPAIGQAILGLFGMVGALAAFKGITFERFTGWHMMIAWAVMQIAFIFWFLASGSMDQVFSF